MARAGIREVAAHAGVAMGTVSHYLNHPGRVSAEKADRIRRSIEALGFVPNSAGRQLRLGTSTAIAYVVPDVSNPFFATIAEGVEQGAAAAGLSVLIGNTNRVREREDAYLQLFEQQQVRGMLVASHDQIEDRLIMVGARGTPTVLVGQRARTSGQRSVSVDDVAGGRLAVEHLIGTGRRAIAFVGGPLTVRQVADRLEGAGQAARADAATSIEVVDVTERTVAGGRAVGAALVARPVGDRPTAVFAANDLLALGLLQALHAAGVAVPDDIALVGYDDIEFAETSLIPLTSVRPPHEGFGLAAIGLLLDQLGGGSGEPEHIVFAPDLVVRQSTAGRIS